MVEYFKELPFSRRRPTPYVPPHRRNSTYAPPRHSSRLNTSQRNATRAHGRLKPKKQWEQRWNNEHKSRFASRRSQAGTCLHPHHAPMTYTQRFHKANYAQRHWPHHTHDCGNSVTRQPMHSHNGINSISSANGNSFVVCDQFINLSPTIHQAAESKFDWTGGGAEGHYPHSQPTQQSTQSEYASPDSVPPTTPQHRAYMLHTCEALSEAQ